MEETATWCCTHIKDQTSSNIFFTCGRSVTHRHDLYLSKTSRKEQLIQVDLIGTGVLFQGRHATQDEITACAYQTVNIDNKYNGAPVQVRVIMGKEPRHFLAIFKGKLIIFEV